MPKTLLDSGSDLFEPIITMLSSEVEHLFDQTVFRKPKVRNTGSQAARLSQLHADVAPPVQLTCGERANVFFAGAEKIQEVQTRVFACLTDAQEDQVLFNPPRRRETFNGPAEPGKGFDRTSAATSHNGLRDNVEERNLIFG